MKVGIFITIFLVGIILIGVIANIWTNLASELGIGATDNTVTTVVYESIDTGDTSDIELPIASDNVAFQTFQATSDHNVTTISIKGFISGSTTGAALTLSLYAVDENYYPTGVPICSHSASLISVATTAPGDWVTATLTTSVNVTSGTYYDIVATYAGASGSAFIWRVDSTTATQDKWAYSTDGGATWTRNVCSPPST
jgi:hypothetical protein